MKTNLNMLENLYISMSISLREYKEYLDLTPFLIP